VHTYSRIYPTLFKDKSDMPPDIRKHIRYPQDLFDIQMQIFAKYHETDPKVFYQGEDIWTYAEVSDQGKTFPMKPTYLTLNLFNPDNLDFLLLVPMTPKGSDNLRSMAVAGCDGSNYGKIIIYQFPKGELVFSPTQTYTIINEEPDIARQFTLWDQAGSKIVRGRVIILPIGRMIFYIQPIYLKSSSPLKIPELQRIIVSEGQIAVMESSMEEAYKKLFEKLSSKIKQEDEQYPPGSD
jgi:uncharacterized protein